MPLIKKLVPTTEEVVLGFTCDKCGAEYSAENDIAEVNEAFHGTHECGYGSVFEDGAVVEVTLCQHCAKDVLGPYMRTTKQNIDWGPEDHPQVVAEQ